MSTNTEILEILEAAEKLAKAYKKIMADGKVNLDDLNALPEILALVESLPSAIKVSQFDWTAITEAEVLAYLKKFVSIAQNFYQVKVEDSNPLQFADVLEILSVFEISSHAFLKVTKDGVVTLTDLPSIFGDIFSLIKNVPAAVKLNGPIHFESFSEDQLSELLLRLHTILRVILEGVNNLTSRGVS